jgi:CRP/FNR family transcriptional regulator, polysaccharide utilization system transcription regulator
MHNSKISEPSCPSCLIKSVSFFHELSNGDLAELNKNKICTFYKKGQTVFYDGRIPTGLYCLEQGKIKIFKVGIDGKEQIVRLASSGSLFGVRALISGRHYQASAATLEDSVICFVSKSFFFYLLKKYPLLSDEIMLYLCLLLEEAEDKIISIAQKPVRERLAETLLNLNTIFSSDGNTYFNYKISIPREDMANIVGTATETVIRLLSEFKEEQLIKIKGRAITLTNIEGLKQTARMY